MYNISKLEKQREICFTKQCITVNISGPLCRTHESPLPTPGKEAPVFTSRPHCHWLLRSLTPWHISVSCSGQEKDVKQRIVGACSRALIDHLHWKGECWGHMGRVPTASATTLKDEHIYQRHVKQSHCLYRAKREAGIVQWTGRGVWI